MNKLVRKGQTQIVLTGSVRKIFTPFARKYALNPDEINYIESKVRPIDLLKDERDDE